MHLSRILHRTSLLHKRHLPTAVDHFSSLLFLNLTLINIKYRSWNGLELLVADAFRGQILFVHHFPLELLHIEKGVVRPRASHIHILR